PGGQVLLVLVGELHVGDVAAHDLHPVPAELPVQQLLHVRDIRAPQVVGVLRLHQAAALADRILHCAGQHQVEVAGADGADEGGRVRDPELQEELDRLERNVLFGGAGEHGGVVGDFGGGV